MNDENNRTNGNPFGCFGWLIVAGLIIWGWNSYQGKVADDQYYKDVAASAEDEAYTNTEKIQELQSRIEELESNTESLRQAVEIISNYLQNRSNN